MKLRLLILTAGYGEGHNAAARALAAAGEASRGPGTARAVDVFALAAPTFNRWSRAAYLELIHFAPGVWNAAYRWADRGQAFPAALRFLRRELRVLRDLIQREDPDVICSTYPVYGFMIDALRRAGVVSAPHYHVVTDSISINSLWWRPDCDGWFLPNEDSADVLRRAGVDPHRLHVLGFPVASFFDEHRADFSPPDLDGTAADRSISPRVLYIANSGARHARELVERLLDQPNWDITCAVGRNETLRRALATIAARKHRPATFLGWTTRIPELLMTHHVVISKAGGATTQEAIAAQCPMLVNQIIPGQEEGNFELLRRHGSGAYAEDPVAVIAKLKNAFADGGRVWREWRAALRMLARPHAAQGIVEFMLARAALDDRSAERTVAKKPFSVAP